MTIKSFKYFILLLKLLLINLLTSCSIINDKDLEIKIFVESQLNHNAYQSKIWDIDFLNKNLNIARKIIMFEQGKICRDLKNYSDYLSLPYNKQLELLKAHGYKCFIKPLRITSDLKDIRYYRTDGSVTNNLQDNNLALQQTCIKQTEGCVVRFKPHGLPHSKRITPHFTLSIVHNLHPIELYDYDNEIAKITTNGKIVPKSPGTTFGFATCPFNDKLWPKEKIDRKCNEWIDEIMNKTHHELKVQP